MPLTDRDADKSVLDHVVHDGDVGRTMGYDQCGPLEVST